MNAVKLNNIQKSLGNFNLNIDNLEVKEGYITGFIGKNGSGKTTTIKLIMNMLIPSSGEITLWNKEMLNNEIEIKQQIAYIGIDSGFPIDSKLKTIKKIISPFYKNWDDNIYKNYIKKFNLDENKKFKDLSQGMKKQFELVIALSHKPKLLIMDEPTANLDPVIRNELLEILNDNMQNGDLSIFYSTHITSDLEKSADFIYFIDKGKIILKGEKDNLLESHRLVKGPLHLLNVESEKLFISISKNSFGFEGLCSDFKNAYNFFGDEANYEKATLDHIMFYYTRGNN
ncbi:ABC transporter ATP-binding protein [Clostridium massiliamazoniense]|uniref:ABC transporter ATP-binding protein n=1 Tax=Clostridium massiliamazoniense TaxID=1347366 RepID=UPI0006D81F62|nr:ABC transporter ATP-binding protein [Clostridium massiliamazoniense]